MSESRPGLFEQAQRAEQRGNRDVRDLWNRYRGHRQHVTAEILALAPAGGRLCVLGAGNANDLELEELAARFEEIHLVDIDAGALARATGRQGAAVRARLRTHAPVDVSGLYHQLDEAFPRRPPGTDVLVPAGTAELLQRLPGEFDVVASCCVLSQISWALENLAGPDQGLLAVLQQAMLRIHLRAMLGLIHPKGAALLVSDLVSSSSYPLDELAPDEDLRALADKLASNRATHAVCNPELVRLVVRRDPELASACQPPQLGQPWLWDGPKELTYLVCPLMLRRR
jgi:hypothetical protein